MPASGSVPEAVAMEYATAHPAGRERGRELAADSRRVPGAGRRDARAARRGAGTDADAGVAAPLLDEMSRRAQERVLLAQVAREMQANLRRMEQVLDAFFRDHAKRAELATLEKDSRQIRGALRMLGQDDAERLLAPVRGADRQLRAARTRWSATRTSSSSPSRSRVWVLRRGPRAAAAGSAAADCAVAGEAAGRGARGAGRPRGRDRGGRGRGAAQRVAGARRGSASCAGGCGGARRAESAARRPH